MTLAQTPTQLTIDKFAVLNDIHHEYFPAGVQSLTGAIYDHLPKCYFVSTVGNKQDWFNGYSDNDKCLSQIQIKQTGEDQFEIHSMRGSVARVRFDKDEPHEPWEYFKLIPLDIPDTTGTFDEVVEVYRKYEKARFDVVQKYGHLM